MGDVYGTPRRKRRRGPLIVLLVLLLILGGVALAVDRVSASYAAGQISQKVAQQVANKKASSDEPQVSFAGFPFLTQVAAGKYREIAIGLPHFSGPVGSGKTIKVPLLDIRARDVRASLSTLRSGGSIVAGSVTGTGTIDYSQLATLIGQSGVKLTEKDGQLSASIPVQPPGQAAFTVTGTAALSVSNGVVHVRFTDVDSAGLPDVPFLKNMITSYARRLSVDLRTPPLPLKLVVQKIEAKPDGLQFTAGASNVTLNSGGL